jgi:hypothetical protein
MSIPPIIATSNLSKVRATTTTPGGRHGIVADAGTIDTIADARRRRPG